MKLLKRLMLMGYQHSQSVDNHIMKSEELHGWPTPRERLDKIACRMWERQEKMDRLAGEIYECGV